MQILRRERVTVETTTSGCYKTFYIPFSSVGREMGAVQCILLLQCVKCEGLGKVAHIRDYGDWWRQLNLSSSIIVTSVSRVRSFQKRI
jgi:hypothetical protein